MLPPAQDDGTIEEAAPNFDGTPTNEFALPFALISLAMLGYVLIAIGL